MLGYIDKLNSVSRVTQERRTARQAVQHATLALDPQILTQTTALRHQLYQRFRLMRVQLISDEQPNRLRIGIDRLGDMRGEVGLGAPKPRALRSSRFGRRTGSRFA